jgi:PadR family transcriptional regulator, regulatory protein PadR
MRSKTHFVNGIPEMLVLRLLSHEEMYGYQLVEALRRRSDEMFQFGEGSLYPILHKLAASGCLTSRREVVGGRPRHYYRTSPKGRKQLEEMSEVWRGVVRGTKAILGGQYA